jgi:hypothetical protein
MTFKNQYINKKPLFLNDKSINPNNRKLFKEFLDYEENKLKRTNGLRELDENSYKTLYEYIIRLKTVNLWFKDKAWNDLTKSDIEKVYNDLEDGKIKNARGQPFKERKNFYNKIFKSKPFKMVGKDEIAREVIQYYKPSREEVRFIDEDDFMKLQRTAIKDNHKLLLWLAWDIGENVNSLLQLKKKNFIRQIEPQTKETEYLIYLDKDILKRTRKQRSEPTLYAETVYLLEQTLKELKEEDYLFDFDYRNAKKIFDRAVRITNIKCKPKGDKPTWKDLRSGMACHLLKKGWTSDEVNGRLGHKFSSSEIDKYLNYLALDRHEPKKKLYNNQLQTIMKELEEIKSREKLRSIRDDQTVKVIDTLKKEVEIIKKNLDK